MRLFFALTAIAPCIALAIASAAPSSGFDDSICEPVTQTVTETINVGAASSAMSTTSYTTITSFSTLTSYSYVTVPSQSTTPEPSSSGYYYIDNNGTTSWLGGVSPPTSDSSFVTKTVKITVLPLPTANPEVTQTRTTTITIVPPAVTSWVSSSPSFTFAPLTTMSTFTSYLTHSVTSTSTVYISYNASSMSLSQALVSTDGNKKHASHVVTTTSLVSAAEVASKLACSVHYTNVTTDITYTVFAGATSKSVTNGYPNATQTASVTLTSLVSAVGTTAPVMNTSSFSLMDYGTTVSPSKNFTTKILTQTDSHGTLSRWTGSSALNKMYTNTNSSATPKATPSVCGEHGDFVLTWEDEPNFVPTTPIISPSDAPPVFNPYHHMYFSDGFVYMPPPSTPFSPVSSPRLVMFLVNDTDSSDGSPDAGGQLSGEIGAGPRKTSDAFWFNADSAYLGCDNEGPEVCNVQISGLVYDKSSSSEIVAVKQSVILPSCPGLQECQLQQVKFVEMKGLSGIRIQVFVGGESRSWFMDNLAMGWYDNSCEAGLLRIRSQ